METIEKKKVLKTKTGQLQAADMPNSKFVAVKTNKGEFFIEILHPSDITSNRNPAYKYLG